MRVMCCVAVALILALATTTVTMAMPSGPGQVRGDAVVDGSKMPPAIREAFEQSPVSNDVLEAALERVERRPAPAPQVRRAFDPQGMRATYVQDLDSFDEVGTLDPFLWVNLQDLNDDGETVYWGNYLPEVSRCRSTSPEQSMWMFGGGIDGSQLDCNDPYPSGANASAIMLLDMTNMFPVTPTLQFDMTFDYWLNLRTFEEGGVVPDGLFVNLVLPRDDLPVPERVTLAHITSEFEERFFDDPWTINLLAAQDVYDPERPPINVYELGVAFIEFLALTQRPTDDNPNPTTLPGGIFVDTIELISDVQPNSGGDLQTATPTPTLPPSATPTPTETPTPSVTPTGPTPTYTSTPTETPTPTFTPGPPPDGIYLPLALYGHDLRAMDGQ